MQKSSGFQWRLVTAFSLLLCAWTAVAQTQFATVNGTITDKTGAAVSNADVVLTSNAQGRARSVKTNNEGTYTFANVDPGQYKISAYCSTAL